MRSLESDSAALPICDVLVNAVIASNGQLRSQSAGGPVLSPDVVNRKCQSRHMCQYSAARLGPPAAVSADDSGRRVDAAAISTY